MPLSARESLQNRLDAIARAYNEGNAIAAEQALWPNHAIVRPNGVTMYRSDVLGQWAREWSDLRNRSLSFAIEEFAEDGPRVAATWSLILTADAQDAQGEWHKFEFTGTQKAKYTRSADEEVLVGPIAYVEHQQTMDGYPWTPQ